MGSCMTKSSLDETNYSTQPLLAKSTSKRTLKQESNIRSNTFQHKNNLESTSNVCDTILITPDSCSNIAYEENNIGSCITYPELCRVDITNSFILYTGEIGQITNCMCIQCRSNTNVCTDLASIGGLYVCTISCETLLNLVKRMGAYCETEDIQQEFIKLMNTYPLAANFQLKMCDYRMIYHTVNNSYKVPAFEYDNVTLKSYMKWAMTTSHNIENMRFKISSNVLFDCGALANPNIESEMSMHDILNTVYDAPYTNNFGMNYILEHDIQNI